MAPADQWIVVLQIAVAAALGAALGLERELNAQPAGLRTHMLVSLGAALFSLAGFVHGSDPTRIAAQVVTGIGFLGGGAILREGPNIRGLTTAASLWVTAAIGLAIGLHWWYAGVGATLLALLVLWAIKQFEDDVLPKRRSLEVVLTLEPDAALDRVEGEAREILPKVRVVKVSYGASGQILVLSAQQPRNAGITVLGERLRRLSGVHGVDVTR
jgi:putative Mg2+ transporter-C (MgtC) family protein